MEAFSNQQGQRFENEMVVYLEQQFPAEFAKTGEPWMRELIGAGIKGAEGYGITLERDVSRYIELMLALAPDFDRSPRTPWAAPILANPRLAGWQKLDGIYERLVFGTTDVPSAPAGAPGSGNAASRGPTGGRAAATPPLPQPFRPSAVAAADEVVRTTHPDLRGHRPTLDPADEPYRRTWLAAYHAAEEEA